MGKWAFILLLLVAASTTQASIISFDDWDTFSSRLGSVTTIDFEENELRRWRSYRDQAHFADVAFQGSGDLYTVDPDYYRRFYDWDSGDVLSDQHAEGRITAYLPQSIYAIGVDLMTFRPFASDVRVILSSGDIFDIATANPGNRTFAGFISDEAISTISFESLSGRFLNIDNFTYSTQVPEPRTYLLFGSAMLVLVFFRRRWKQLSGDNYTDK
ncbi:MAG: PEP-CTERM sorting domain-containing protein [gamma proteobacterium endosymbiont of Lamellibrachia anaximandri]|nr:PEP-CTERM sorting domain-containing protein [gamma proteobacterium endosymbiont of Lamellibrachia anaximandri]MBL3532258.1 PEP-CTERM sorting domain-containing protein [gamma proteobacterium endosymbiont of Lamellibrachia anaximandri]MBL3599484.1 PEP-CTERM sorting domain-containing protein [gamma proteobacterium endosymbiont of Lamellibrachia anaximandri]